MKRKIIFIILALQLYTFTALHLYAFDMGHAKADGGMPGAYLSWGAGARSLSMGKAYVGLSDDASAVYWNPAGLTQLKKREMVALHSVLWENTSYSFVAYSQPFIKVVELYRCKDVEGKEIVEEKELFQREKNHGVIGVAIVNLGSSGFQRRNEYNEPGGKTGLSETAGIISYAKKLSVDVSGGINVKIANQRIDTYSDTGYGVDVGFLWRPGDRLKLIKSTRWLGLLFFPTAYQIPPIVRYLEPLSVGLNIQNLISPKITLKEETDKFPLNVTLGLGYRLFKDKLTLAIDTNKTKNRSVKMHYGLEFSPYDIFGIRVGLDETEVTAGFGIKLADFDLDYAFAYHNAWKGHEDLGASHRFGMTYRWGGTKSAESWKLNAESKKEGVEIYRYKAVKQQENEVVIEDVETATSPLAFADVHSTAVELYTFTPKVITSYTVRSGDCLWNIAKKSEVYNNPLEWTRIYEANKDKIKKVDLIYSGQELVIPRDMVSELK